MKKIYKAPLTKVVIIKAGQMLTGSILDVKNTAITDDNKASFTSADKDYDDEDVFDDLW